MDFGWIGGENKNKLINKFFFEIFNKLKVGVDNFYTVWYFFDAQCLPPYKLFFEFKIRKKCQKKLKSFEIKNN